MKVEKQKPIDVIANRPKVVLIGNGLLLSSYAKDTAKKGKNKMWIEHIFDIGERVLTDEDVEKYKDVPYSILATAITPIEDTKRRKNYAKSFDTIVLKEKSLLERLLSLPFDVILTTNYTYEIENIFNILKALNANLWNLTTCINCVYHCDCTIENILPGNEDTKFCSFEKLRN